MSGERALADFALHESVCINAGPFPHAAHDWTAYVSQGEARPALF